VQIAEALGEIEKQFADEILHEAKQIGKMIYGLRRSIKTD
jgi:hypothetical protein